MSSRGRIVVVGLLVRAPLGGLSWHYLNYLAGLASLGYDVWYLEDSDEYPACYDPSQGCMTADPNYGAAYADRAMQRIDLTGRWAYFDWHTRGWLGPAAPSAVEICRTADVLIDISGVNLWRPWTERIPCRLLIDTDPAFTQVRNIQDPRRRAHVAHFTSTFSFASSIGLPGCAVPLDGFDWRPTRQPVALDWWEVSAARGRRFTTLMQWESYPAVAHHGARYANKAESFTDFESLPTQVSATLALAVGDAHPGVREHLAGCGWEILDPLHPSLDPWSFQEFVESSTGEFSVAKQGYVTSRSGWFSERSLGYMASGRSVVVQDTGFSDWLPVGRGVFAFSTMEQAVSSIECVLTDPATQGRAAREIAESFFRSDLVLEELLSIAAAARGMVG